MESIAKINKRIDKTGLLKKFIAKELGIDDTYFAMFFMVGKKNFRPMPKKIYRQLDTLLTKYEQIQTPK